MKILSLLIALAISHSAMAEPPFSGTIFIDPDIITDADPSTFQQVEYQGQGLRTMFDRRVNGWISNNAYLFAATFDDGLNAEIQVNSEFGSEANARVEAVRYGEKIGQLPTSLRVDVRTVWIHKGSQPFGGGNNNLLIHTGQSEDYIANGILEETLVHEAAHTSLDATHASSSGWLNAQILDNEFISTYARDNPQREDIAESILPYLAVRYREDRISTALKETIESTIPNRILYFDAIGLDWYPIAPQNLIVDIDVDPWSGNNLIKPNSDFPIPVAVLGSGEFDVMQIDPATVKLAEATNFMPMPWFHNIDGDAGDFPDAVFGFATEETGIFCNDTKVTLTGETYSGILFEGTSAIDATDCAVLMCHPL